MKSEGVVFIILRKSFSVFSVWSVDFFLGSLKARNLLGKSCLRCCLRQEIICNSGRQQTKSLTKISTENALEYLAFGDEFIMDRLTARIFGAVRAENKSKNLFFAESRQK